MWKNTRKVSKGDWFLNGNHLHQKFNVALESAFGYSGPIQPRLHNSIHLCKLLAGTARSIYLLLCRPYLIQKVKLNMHYVYLLGTTR